MLIAAAFPSRRGTRGFRPNLGRASWGLGYPEQEGHQGFPPKFGEGFLGTQNRPLSHSSLDR
jgi:hypothetical protein